MTSMESGPMNDVEPNVPRYTLWQLALYALKLGSIGFGGAGGFRKPTTRKA
jgi:hypothetical protein